MTEKEKLLDILKVAYEPRKIPQEDGSVVIYYPADEYVADMIEAAIIDEYKHRAEVYEEMFDILYEETSKYMRVLSKEWYKVQAEREIEKEKK